MFLDYSSYFKAFRDLIYKSNLNIEMAFARGGGKTTWNPTLIGGPLFLIL